MTLVLQLIFLTLMVASLATVPFGLPGVWVMVALLLGPTLFGWISWVAWLVCLAVAVVAEGAEFLLLKRLGDRYGGTGAAFWGGILGGFVGIFVGVPVPVVGSLVAAIVGTFVGAMVVTLWESRSATGALKVGWGMTVARVLAVVLKVGTGAAIIALTASALFFGGR